MEVSRGQVRSWQLIWRGERNLCPALEAGFTKRQECSPLYSGGFCTVIDDSDLTVYKEKSFLFHSQTVMERLFALARGVCRTGHKP